MDDQKLARRGLTIMILWTAVICLLDWHQQDRRFSENENRLLAQAPELSLAALMSGSYMQEYETYLSDQFVARDVWIKWKTYAEKWLGKQEINGVYLLEDGTLVGRLPEASVTEAAENQKTEVLKKEILEMQQEITGKCYLMLVPGAAWILRDKLPAHAGEYDQGAFLQRIREQMPEDVVWVDTQTLLQENRAEKLYYGSDHHWTIRGAFYGYQALRKAWGKEEAKISEYVIESVSRDFLGTLHSRLNLPIKADTIETYTWREEPEYVVNYVYEGYERNSFYEPSHLKTKDQYAFFLDGNHPLIVIAAKGGHEKKESLLVVKNSYANCLIPFLTRDYEKIYIVDPRYYRAEVNELAKEYRIQDVLYLYDIPGFLGK